MRHLALQQVGVVCCHSQPPVLPSLDLQGMFLIYHNLQQLDIPSWPLTTAWLKRPLYLNQQLTCCSFYVAHWLVELEYQSALHCHCPQCSLQHQKKVQAQQFCNAIVTSSSSHQCSEGSSCNRCSISTEASCISVKTMAASAGGAELNLHLPPQTLHVGQCGAAAGCNTLFCLTACCCIGCCLPCAQDWQHLQSPQLLQLGWLGSGTHRLRHASYCRCVHQTCSCHCMLSSRSAGHQWGCWSFRMCFQEATAQENVGSFYSTALCRKA